MKNCTTRTVLPLFFISILSIASCASGVVLEHDGTTRFRTQVIVDNGNKKVKVTGSTFYKGYGIKETQISYKDDTANILVHLTPTSLPALHPNAEGGFGALVPIGHEINKITFGKNQLVVWERPPKRL